MAHTRLGIVAGCWDALHDGHRWFLRQALQHVTGLVVLVATDGSIRRSKLREPLVAYPDRRAAVREFLEGEMLRGVDPFNPRPDRHTYLEAGPIDDEDHEIDLDYWLGRHPVPNVMVVGLDQLQEHPDKLDIAVRHGVQILALPRSPFPVSSTAIYRERQCEC